MKTLFRALIEIGFIIFLFYSNLLMGEFERSGAGRVKGLEWALSDVFTTANFEVAIVAAGIGYVLVELLRTRLWPDSNRRRNSLFVRQDVDGGSVTNVEAETNQSSATR
jgi:hypothetical protein